MNKPILKDMIQNEILTNPTFQKGRKCTNTLMFIYIAVRFSDPIVSPILANIPFEISFQILFGLFTALCIGLIAVKGSVKLAGVLCLLTPVGNTTMMMIAARSYVGGFVEMMNTAPTAWYVLATSIICAIIGVWLLADKTIAAFGKRRKTLQKEYVLLLKAGATAPIATREWTQEKATAVKSERLPEKNIASDAAPGETENRTEAR